MGRQLFGIELPQGGRQALPEARRNSVSQRLHCSEGLRQERRVGFFRARQHQVGLELGVGHTGTLATFGAIRRELDQRVELLLQSGRDRIAHQAIVGLDVTRPQGGQ
ncbi:hypothetical protein D3C84_831180 [compost metagenome]